MNRINTRGHVLAVLLLTSTGTALATSAASLSTQQVPIPLASYEHGQTLVQEAVSKITPDLRFKFLDKTYENDQYTKILGEKVRTACVRFRTTSGFQFRMSPPSFRLTSSGLRVENRINRIEANGLTFRFQLGPCAEVSAGFGVKLSDVKVIYEARPTISFDTQGLCRVHWNEDPDSVRISIGDLNVIGVQNDLDGLAKDAVREAANRLFKTVFESMRNDLTKISVNVCGGQKRNPLLRS